MQDQECAARIVFRIATALVSLTMGTLAHPGHSSATPATPKQPASNVYHGVAVGDDYQWLEDWNDPRVREWSAAQNALARAYLDAIPERVAILDRVAELRQSLAPEYRSVIQRGGKLFAIKDEPPKEQPFLVVFDSVDDAEGERVLVDPSTLDPGGHTTIDFFVPSPDGSHVAVSLSRGGSEDGTVSVFATATGERLPDSIPRVNGGTAGGSVAWTADGAGLYRTRYPDPSTRPAGELPFHEQVYYHRLGTAAEDDVYAFGRDLPRIAEIFLTARDGGPEILADVLNGDGGEHAFWLHDPETRSWTQIAGFGDECVRAHFGASGDEGLYLLSYSGAPTGKILRLALDQPELKKARRVVEPSTVAIEDFLPTASRMVVLDVVGGPSRIRLFDHAGTQLGLVPLPLFQAVNDLVHLGADDFIFRRQSYTQPSGWYRFDPTTWKVMPTRLLARSPADFADVEVRREFAPAKDGTRIPINLLVRKGTPTDGTAPTILYGYGGYGISQKPTFDATRRLWLDQGGIWAIANVRGGGEFGEPWHLAGKLTRKQNVFDDFAACAEYLIDRGYTSRERLAIQGGSNGGLLMGAVLVQRPELFRAVVSRAGIYDMLRVELTPNGEFNTTEFGSVKDAEQWKALHAYSPYHHVVDGVSYPAVLFLTGANDPRVDPMHSRKMIARLKTASASAHPILLRTSAHTGHGGGTPLSSRNEELGDIYAFLFKELGLTGFTAGARVIR